MIVMIQLGQKKVEDYGRLYGREQWEKLNYF